MEASPIAFRRYLDPADRTRADVYAILARLFADAPDRAFLQALAGAPKIAEGAENRVAGPWNRLVDASAAMDAEAAAQEYTDLFVGVGKSEVNLHASHWIAGFMIERPLVELRAQLAGLGIGRKEASNLLEDHFSALCETMRLLVAGDEERNPASIETQRNFFEARLLPWAPACCAAIIKHSLANYYQRVAEFGTEFLALERESLSMD